MLKGPVRRRWLEGLLLFVHLAGYLTAVFLVLSWPRALAFLAVQQGLFGLYLGCAFAPNHKGMPVLGEEDDLDFLRRQVLTSRNVSGGRLTETMLGGLNYQIEHHLFPAMPRPALRRCRTWCGRSAPRLACCTARRAWSAPTPRCCVIFMRRGSERGRPDGSASRTLTARPRRGRPASAARRT